MAALGVGGLWLALVPTVAAASVFAASLVGTTDVFSSGNLLVSGLTPDAINCASSASTISSNAATCVANPLPATTLSTTAISATTTLSSPGSLSASSGLVGSSGCAIQQFTDASSAATDPALPAYGVTLNSPMTTLSSTSAAFDGSTGWGETVKSFANPENFSVAGWFKTSSAQGTLWGFSSVQTTAGSTSNDRELWIDSAGKLVWATSTSSTLITEVTSPLAYNNGAWHYVVATIGTANKDQLYVDGSLVASATATAAYSYTGYWTLGWGSELSATPAWTDKPTNAYFKGSLAGVAVIPAQLSAAQIATLYAASTQSTYNAAVAALSPTSYWPMTDVGSAGYSGALPGLAATTVKFYDASGSSNTGAPGTGTVTTGAAGPLGGLGVSLSGAAGSAINGATSAASVQTTSQSIWFNTTSSGVLMSRSNLATDGGTATDSDHMLWIDATGHLVYGVAYGATPTRVEATSPLTYNDGVWHVATATVSASAITLYVDGVQVATAASAASVQSYTGYWHLGYGYTTGWSDAPSSAYGAASLAHAAVYPTTLSAAQVSALAAAQTTLTEQYAVLALTPSAYWPLYDKITSPACATVEVTIGAVKGASTSCVEPYLAASACAAPTTSVEANTLLPKALPAPISGTSVALSITLKLTATPAVGVAGLHVLIPLSFMTQYSGFSAQVSYPAAQAVL